MTKVLVALVVFLLALPAAANSMILESETLEIETGTTALTDYNVSYVDSTTTTFSPAMGQGNISFVGTTTALAAPPASTQRQVKWLTVTNRSTTASQTVIVKVDTAGTDIHVTPRVSLAPGETMHLNAQGRLEIYATGGDIRRRDYDNAPIVTSILYPYFKVGTAKDAAGYYVAHGKDAGVPGAYVLGTPGINGVVTDCSLSSSASPAGATQLGAAVVGNPTTGALYLSRPHLSGSVAEYLELVDVIYYNTGLVVTTTTAQAVTQPAIPARDSKGLALGHGIGAALLVTKATTNAAAISNTTISYTDQDGNAGNVGTFSAVAGANAPATPVIGTWMPFQLAAGDSGVRSVQSVTLGTSYVAGAVSLVLYRTLATIPQPVANVGGALVTPLQDPGTRIYGGSCIWSIARGSASATTVAGSWLVTER